MKKLWLIMAMLPVFFISIPAEIGASGEEILIIANKSLKLESISVAEARSIFLGKRKSVSGVNLTPLNAKTGSQLRSEFGSRVLGMTADEEKRYWENEKIQSGGRPPASFSSTAKAVFKVKTGVSYVYASSHNDSIAKVLLRVPAN